MAYSVITAALVKKILILKKINRTILVPFKSCLDGFLFRLQLH